MDKIILYRSCRITKLKSNKKVLKLFPKYVNIIIIGELWTSSFNNYKRY